MFGRTIDERRGNLNRWATLQVILTSISSQCGGCIYILSTSNYGANDKPLSSFLVDNVVGDGDGDGRFSSWNAGCVTILTEIHTKWRAKCYVLCVHANWMRRGLQRSIETINVSLSMADASKSIFMYPITESPASAFMARINLSWRQTICASIKSFVLFSNITERWCRLSSFRAIMSFIVYRKSYNYKL